MAPAGPISESPLTSPSGAREFARQGARGRFLLRRGSRTATRNLKDIGAGQGPHAGERSPGISVDGTTLHFYLVSDQSSSPDPFVQRGYFVGSAQLVLEGGRWLVDTFTTTHVPCSF